LRPGHKSSGGLEEGFEADTQFKAILKTVQQGELVDENCPQHKPLGIDQALSRDLAVTIKDTFEVLIEVFDRNGTELMQDTPHLLAVV
jgi:hypothetical protein